MKGMKEAAPKEIAAVRSRTIKSYAMGRIDKDDQDFIVERLDEVLDRVETMDEREE
jgi:hypothetical protein